MDKWIILVGPTIAYNFSIKCKLNVVFHHWKVEFMLFLDLSIGTFYDFMHVSIGVWDVDLSIKPGIDLVMGIDTYIQTSLPGCISSFSKNNNKKSLRDKKN